MKLRSSISLWAILLTAMSSLSLTVTPAPYWSYLGVTSLAGFVAVILALESGISNRLKWKQAASGFTAAVSLHLAWALSQWISGEHSEALRGNFTNPDCYCAILSAVFFVALGLACEASKAPQRAFYILCSLQLLTGILLTASRSGAIGAVAGYACFLFVLASSRSQRLRATAKKLLLLPGLLALILTITGGKIQLLERFSHLSQAREAANLKGRADVVRYGWKSVARTPIVGSGLGCFSLAYQQDRPPILTGEDYMNVAHNDYIQWMVETGVPGFFLWVSLLAVSARRIWGSYKLPTAWVAGQLASLLSFCVYTLGNFACPVPADLYCFGVSLGLGGALSQLQSSPSSGVARWRPVLFPVILSLSLLGLFGMLTTWRAVEAQKAEREALIKLDELDWESAAQILENVANGQPENFQVQLLLADVAQKGYLFFQEPRWIELEGNALRKALDCNGRDLRVLLRNISYQQRQGNYDQAEQLIIRAERSAPYSRHVRRAAARNEIFQGRLTEAAETLAILEKTGLQIDDTALAELIFLLERHNPGEGVKLIRKIPDNEASRARQLGLDSVKAARRLKDQGTALRILKFLVGSDSRNFQAQFQIAEVRAEVNQIPMSLKLLDSLRSRSNELDEKLRVQVWERWTQLHIQQADYELIYRALQDYLISYPRDCWPRTILADLYIRQFKKAEAREVLREGLQYDEDGSLRMKLADVCSQQGFSDLARSYYQDAMRYAQQRKAAEERLRQVKPSQEELEIEKILAPTEGH